MSAVRRVRAYPGLFALVAALVLVAAFLITGMPRMANRLADDGLRESVARQQPAVRDITYREEFDPFEITLDRPSREQQLGVRHRAMPPAVRDVVDESWHSAETMPVRATGPDLRPGPPLELILRSTTGGREAVSMVAGRWPAGPTAPDAPVEVVVPRSVADELGLRVGSLLRTPPGGYTRAGRMVAVVGVFEPVDPAGGVWDVEPRALRVIPPPPDAAQGSNTAVALTSTAGIAAVETGGSMKYLWRYRVAPERFEAGNVPEMIDGLRALQRQPERDLRLVLGLDAPLLEFQRTYATARGVLAVVIAGVLACLGGLVILAAALAGRRRRDEVTLLRARGGSTRTVAGRGLAEALLVVPPAALIGWSAGLAVPGRAGGTVWLLLIAAAFTVAALPVAAMVAPVDRGRPGPLSVSTRRLTAEAFVVLLAVLGVVLLRGRGLPAAGEVDPLLAAVPVLVAVGAALLVARGYPWPLRAAGRLSAGGRGTVPFLGLARAGRATVTGSLVVVALGVTTAVFCGVVTAGVDAGRDRAAALAVPADALVTGVFFAPDTADALAALPGVRAVTPVAARTAQDLHGAAGDRAEAIYLLVVDGDAFARTVAESGAAVDVPVSLTGDPGPGPAPAVVSPSVAADLSGEGTVLSSGERLPFRVATVRDRFPGIGDHYDRFVVLPRQALTAEVAAALTPTGFLVAGAPPDRAELRRVGDEGQRRFLSTGLVTGKAEPSRPSVVTTRSEARQALESGGANGTLRFGFVAGITGGAALGLLAIAFVVLAGARDRGLVLARLRTMGLSRAQWRGLVVVELTPLVGAATFTGALAGILLPPLLTPALDLSVFTAGVPVRVGFDIGLAAGVVVLGGLALATAIAVEAVMNRRLRLGDVLRLGEGD
ncbi:hypothetical protein [Plantactinospora sp. GCM10030261]|uniref:hypothetical protein n=1 Tax=Plantactinospora sp. GCM10030261 TaxID=3273420 RepID=UPI00360FAFCA